MVKQEKVIHLSEETVHFENLHVTNKSARKPEVIDRRVKRWGNVERQPNWYRY